MVHPSDPNHPQGGAEQFGETQIGVPNLPPGYGAPAPQYPPPTQTPPYSQPAAPPPYQQQFAPSQYTQNQYPQNQYTQAPYQQPFSPAGYPPPYGPGQFSYGQPTPAKKSRTPLVLSLIGVVAVAAAVLAVVIVAPWKSSEPDEVTETFSLSDGVTVEVRLPAGWDAAPDTDDGKTLIRIHQNDDDRLLSQLSDNLKSLSDSGSGSEMHTVVLFADDCASSVPATDWTTKNRDDSSTRHAERWMYASSRIDDRRCVNLSGVDGATDPVTAGSQARDLVKKLIDEDRVTAAKAV
ncbi:hypothetical protein [Gordonia hydrophobica]|uniref:Uncharacterized protein n=1 Tax=Gordonia hydrophobica TaxID=40516 RepID=A0ABZ2U711_9ACTN|nr:hypothetical protein [Gordonia hydrophobica]MBM7366117.1 hypothetical protein [Gordonia hydrophobica]